MSGTDGRPLEQSEMAPQNDRWQPQLSMHHSKGSVELRAQSAFSLTGRSGSIPRPNLESGVNHGDGKSAFEKLKAGLPPNKDITSISRSLLPGAQKQSLTKVASDPAQDLQKQLTFSSLNGACFCGKKDTGSELFYMCRCKNIMHKSCMPWRISDFGQFECTACTILTNDPLNEVLEVLLEPSVLENCFTYRFKLKIDEFEKLNSNDNLDIEVRCIKMDGQHFFEQSWPDRAEIKVNELKVKDVSPLLQNSSLKKRKDEKLVITNPKMGTNTICFNYENVKDGKNSKVDRDPMYIFTVVLIQKLTVTELSENIIQNKTISISSSKSQIRTRFQSSRDVKISEMKADLDCKISFTMPMVHPAKGENCTHLNCFSLNYFLKSMKSNAARNWACPLCRKPCYKLVVDSYMELVSKEAGKIDPNKREVFFKRDGNYILSPEKELASDMLSNAGSSKMGTKRSVTKSQRGPIEHIVLTIDDDHKTEKSSAQNITDKSKSQVSPHIEEKSTLNLSEDQSLGKRQSDNDMSFLDDKEFLGYLHNYSQKCPSTSKSTFQETNRRPGFSSFESNLKTRIETDLLANRAFQMFYSLIMNKRKEKEAQKKKTPPLKDLYSDLISDLRIADREDDCKGSSQGRQLDVLQWLLKEYRLEYHDLIYLQDKPSDEDRNSMVIIF